MNRCRLDPASERELRDTLGRLDTARPTSIGFPGAVDFSYSVLAPFLDRLVNNIGDPYVDGRGGDHTKHLEREVVELFADLFRVPGGDRWGYVTTGGTEGNLYGLYAARNRYPDGVVYHSQAAHYSVAKAADLLAVPAVAVRTTAAGEIDYRHLHSVVAAHRDRPAIVVANIGTTMTEAVDDTRRITAVLDALDVYDRHIHSDAALAGVPLALLDPDRRPGFDLADGADSIAVSGHKFIGAPFPCGVVVTRRRLQERVSRAVAYTGSPDTTITGSRSGHAPLILWYALRSHGVDGLRRRAEQCRRLAEYTTQQLAGIGWHAWRNPLGFTVVLHTPPEPVTRRWTLAEFGGWSHIVCVPGVTTAQVDAFVQDLRACSAEPAGGPGRPPGRQPELVA